MGTISGASSDAPQPYPYLIRPSLERQREGKQRGETRSERNLDGEGAARAASLLQRCGGLAALRGAPAAVSSSIAAAEVALGGRVGRLDYAEERAGDGGGAAARRRRQSAMLRSARPTARSWLPSHTRAVRSSCSGGAGRGAGPRHGRGGEALSGAGDDDAEEAAAQGGAMAMPTSDAATVTVVVIPPAAC